MKNSFSLIGILVIVFAMTTAFTTRTKSFTPNTWEIFGVQNNSVTSSSSVSAIYSSKLANDFNRIYNSAHTDVDAEIAAFNSANPFIYIVCEDDNTNLCAVIVSYLNTPSYELVLIDFILGDFQYIVIG